MGMKTVVGCCFIPSYFCNISFEPLKSTVCVCVLTLVRHVVGRSVGNDDPVVGPPVRLFLSAVCVRSSHLVNVSL